MTEHDQSSTATMCRCCGDRPGGGFPDWCDHCMRECDSEHVAENAGSPDEYGSEETDR